MASNPESVADIVRIMRGIRYPISRSPDLQMLGYADRIEAAHNREVEHRAIIAGASLADGEVAKLQRDNTKLKAALDKIYKCVDNRYGVDASLLVKSIIANALEVGK